MNVRLVISGSGRGWASKWGPFTTLGRNLRTSRCNLPF